MSANQSHLSTSLSSQARAQSSSLGPMRWLAWLILGVIAAALATTTAHAAEPGKIPVRVVVVTTFELGNDTGDTPGEFQNWVEHLPLPRTLPFPLGNHQLRYNAEKQVLGIV